MIRRLQLAGIAILLGLFFAAWILFGKDVA
jgi:hypothetical protein